MFKSVMQSSLIESAYAMPRWTIARHLLYC